MSTDDTGSYSSTDSGDFPFSSIFTIGYFVLTYLFMVLYLVRNDLFRLSTFFNNFEFLSFAHCISYLLNNFVGFLNVTSILNESITSAIEELFIWSGPAFAPML